MTDDLPQQFKDLGVDGLKTLMGSGGVAQSFHRAAAQWIALKEREAEEARAAIMSRQLAEASHAAAAAEREAAAAERAAEAAERAVSAAERQAAAAESANKRATIALVISIVSIIASVILAVLKIQG